MRYIEVVDTYLSQDNFSILIAVPAVYYEKLVKELEALLKSDAVDKYDQMKYLVSVNEGDIIMPDHIIKWYD